MRIAMLSSSGRERCGIRQYSETLCAYLEKAGAEIVRIPVEQEEVPVPRYIARIRNNLISARPDLVHIQHEFSFFRGILGTDFICLLLGLRGLDIPVVVTMHAVLRLKRPNIRAFRISQVAIELVEYLRWCFAYFAVFFAISLATYRVVVHTERCRSLMPIRQKVSVIPHGTEVSDEIKSRYLRDRDTLRVITFGFFHSLEGIDVAYRAVTSMPDVDYLVAGSLGLDSKENVLRADYFKCLRSEKPNNVSIIICCPVPSRLIAWSDVVLLPYRRSEIEHASAVFHTALSLGKPIVEALQKMRSNELRRYYQEKSRELSRKTAFSVIADEHMRLYQRVIDR